MESKRVFVLKEEPAEWNFDDVAFAAFCIGCAVKYEQRAGLKPGSPAEQDQKKAAWYRQMAAHALGNGPDPRTYREGNP